VRWLPVRLKSTCSLVGFGGMVPVDCLSDFRRFGALLLTCMLLHAGASHANVGAAIAPIPTQLVTPGERFSYRISVDSTTQPIFRMLNAPDGATLTSNGDGTATFSWQVPMVLSDNNVVIIQTLDSAQARVIDTGRLVISKARSKVEFKSDSDSPKIVEGQSRYQNPSYFQNSEQVTADNTSHGKVTPDEPVTGNKALSLEVATVEKSELEQNTSLPALPVQRLEVGQEYQLIIRPLTPAGTTAQLFAPVLPAGASLVSVFNGASLFRWLPHAQQIGEHEISFSVSNVDISTPVSTRDIVFQVTGSDTAVAAANDVSELEPFDGSMDRVSSDTPPVSLNEGATELPLAAEVTVLASSKDLNATPLNSEQQSGEFAAKTGESSLESSRSTNEAPYIEPIPIALLSAGQTARFKVVPRLPDESTAVLHIDRLPNGASFDENDDGTRTFYWPTTLSDQGEHIFRFTAIHPVDADLRVSSEAMIVVGDPSAEGSRPAD